MQEAYEYIEKLFSDKFFDGNHKAHAVKEKTLRAISKQIPQRPKTKEFVHIDGFKLRCPNTDCEAVLQSDSPCCKYCGQSLDWSDVK